MVRGSAYLGFIEVVDLEGRFGGVLWLRQRGDRMTILFEGDGSDAAQEVLFISGLGSVEGVIHAIPPLS